MQQRWHADVGLAASPTTDVLEVATHPRCQLYKARARAAVQSHNSEKSQATRTQLKLAQAVKSTPVRQRGRGCACGTARPSACIAQESKHADAGVQACRQTSGPPPRREQRSLRWPQERRVRLRQTAAQSPAEGYVHCSLGSCCCHCGSGLTVPPGRVIPAHVRRARSDPALQSFERFASSAGDDLHWQPEHKPGGAAAAARTLHRGKCTASHCGSSPEEPRRARRSSSAVKCTRALRAGHLQRADIRESGAGSGFERP